MKNINFLRHAQSGGKRMGGIVGIRKVCHVGENARGDRREFADSPAASCRGTVVGESERESSGEEPR